ncbi:type II toxin-antitoxin system VapC family toxin [Saccharolobus islandicus]|uniref:VapC-type toxin n=3 Tax=Saccharolobus islandicus TaxID=43080 RepID=F0NG92_SACI5|nr:type II toxin-antitoxin system VapC family toxin [Sulfolobus islandicus]ACP37259.1 PilT protein domain protein [Sulfolobus islandicus M.14.25]ACP54405.1 PilT protein domain protein [Sulfolobus islandicus M.16.27]ADX84464.1 VapC-type toxin [Sulfolobus islandicus REY15A]
MTSKGKYFDVNVFVYYLTGDRIYGERAKKWLSIKDDDKYTSIITPFLLIIVLSRILGKSIKDYNFIKTAITALESLGIGYLELPEWSKIVENVRKYSIDIEDSIHVTTALENGLEIVSNDEELKKKVNAEF